MLRAHKNIYTVTQAKALFPIHQLWKLVANFYTIFHLFIADRGRERFEATIRLGNASLFNSYENGERKINQHFVILFEKHVSRTFYHMSSIVFYFIIHSTILVEIQDNQL